MSDTQTSVCWQDLETLELLMPDTVQRVLVFGPAATGKTYFPHALAAKLGIGCYDVTLNQDTSSVDLIGCHMPDGSGGVKWLDGPVASAMREGAMLVLNEVDDVGPDAATILFAVLDNVETARISLPTGEQLAPAKGFCCVATTNGSPDALTYALRSRFQCKIFVDTPAPGILERLEAANTGSFSFSGALLGAYQSVDGTSESEPWVNSRELLAFTSLIGEVDEEQAARLVWGAASFQTILDHLKLGTRSDDDEDEASDA